LVAIVGAPIIILAIYQDHHAWLWGLIFAASLLAMWEFFAMSLDDARDRWASLVCGAAAAAAFYWLRGRGGEMLALFAAIVPTALYYLFRFGDMTSVANRLTASVAGILYGGILFAFLALLKRDAGGDFVVLVLAVAWVGDTGAYFAGRFLGKTKLYPAVSPGKTWAGAFGGLAASVATAVVFKLTRIDYLSWADVILLSAPAAALGQLGDLVESMIKRSRGVKDSGSILPGHGGILDRIDAVLFIAPYTYLYLVFAPQLRALF
ncbi:MAG TPA: phosphatidate cytidylyltransferase, partial [Kofleriaceae bacterium]|nr:phosphatidate cytidylyltransferase [Kofleriaceae bacterium]